MAFLVPFLAVTQLVLADQVPLESVATSRSQPATCPNAGLSCQIGANITDTCCINYPGGQFALTQFWNSDASKGPPGYLGPAESWTIHGLWPDHCDGSYDASCDPSRNGVCSRSSSFSNGHNGHHGHIRCNHAYSNIHMILEKFGRNDLLEYMGSFWKGIQSDEHIWEHEWSKHGTCVSTLEPECYGDNYIETEEVVDYFATAVEIFQTLPTYYWLKDAGIVPSEDRTYDLDSIMTALSNIRAVSPIVACDHDELREVWYFFNVRGSVQTGQFIASEPRVANQHMKGCPETGIKYLPKQV